MLRRTAASEGNRDNMAAQEEMPRTNQAPASGVGAPRAELAPPERRPAKQAKARSVAGAEASMRQRLELPNQSMPDAPKLDLLNHDQPNDGPQGAVQETVQETVQEAVEQQGATKEMTPEPPKPAPVQLDPPKQDAEQNWRKQNRLQQTATTISEALRRAEIANHRELADTIARLLVQNGEIRETEAARPHFAASMQDLVRRGAGRARQASAWLASDKPDKAPEQKPKLSRILALDRTNCSVIASWRLAGVSVEPTSILVGAIRQFASREFAGPQGELRVLHFHGGRVLLRASAGLILAAQFLGEPHPDDRARLDSDFKALIKKETLCDADLAGVAVRLRTEAPVMNRKRLFVAVAAAATLALCVAWWLPRAAAPEARLQELFASALGAQPQLTGWPLNVAVDRESHVASANGVAPADADLDALSKNLPASPPWRWEMNVARVASAEALQQSETRIKTLDEKLRLAEDRLAALDGRLDGLEKWRAERAAEAEGPAARLARLTRNTVILFLDDDIFFDPDLARRQIAEIAARLKETDERLRIVGYTDAHGRAPKNLALSRARAGAVKDALVEEGIDAKRLVAVGRADHAPIAAENSSDRRRNRRVTFELMGATD